MPRARRLFGPTVVTVVPAMRRRAAAPAPFVPPEQVGRPVAGIAATYLGDPGDGPEALALGPGLSSRFGESACRMAEGRR